jgi:hypothetical protein
MSSPLTVDITVSELRNAAGSGVARLQFSKLCIKPTLIPSVNSPTYNKAAT